MDQTLSVDNIDGISSLGVTEIVDPSDLRNGRLPKVAADPTFYDIIEWLKDEVPQIQRHSFFTPVAVNYVGETMVVFSGAQNGGNPVNVLLDAAAIRVAAKGTEQSPRDIFEGSASARCALELAFSNRFTPRRLYPGFDARHPNKTNPIGKVRLDWGSGPMYEFAAGANPAEFPETDPAANHPLYRFFVDGEWLVFERTKKFVLKGGKGTMVPAWRLQGR